MHFCEVGGSWPVFCGCEAHECALSFSPPIVLLSDFFSFFVCFFPSAAAFCEPTLLCFAYIDWFLNWACEDGAMQALSPRDCFLEKFVLCRGSYYVRMAPAVRSREGKGRDRLRNGRHGHDVCQGSLFGCNRYDRRENKKTIDLTLLLRCCDVTLS